MRLLSLEEARSKVPVRWVALIEELYNSINKFQDLYESRATPTQLQALPVIGVVEVNSKFDRLRVYTNYSDLPELEDFLEGLEYRSKYLT